MFYSLALLLGLSYCSKGLNSPILYASFGLFLLFGIDSKGLFFYHLQWL